MIQDTAAVVASPAQPIAPLSAKQEKRIPELDGVRGLAILFVLLFHYLAFETPPSGVLMPVRMMWSGVDLFFVLSGFLIGGILIDHKDSPRYFTTFYARRFYRIIPIYYILLAILAIGAFWRPEGSLFKSAMPLWPYPFFLQNFLSPIVGTFGPPLTGVTWSIAIEEQFYLLLPLAVRRLSIDRLLKIIAGCILLAPLLRTLLILNGARFETVHPLLPLRADDLALGVLAAIIVRKQFMSSWIQDNAWALYSLAAAAFAVMVSLVKFATWEYLGTFGYSAYAVFYFCFLLSVLRLPNPVVNAVLRSRPLRWLGTTSYCIYLAHEGIRYALFNAFGQRPVIRDPFSLSITLAALALTLVTAQVSWVLIERPLTRRAHGGYKY